MSFTLKKFKGKMFWVILLLFIVWILIDLLYPFKRDIRKVDGSVMAHMDAAMWRSYYEKKKIKLFLEASSLMREQFHFPFWRSQCVAYYAAKAAFVFKDGHSREDYEKALPWLKKYYSLINRIDEVPFNVDSAAACELEWWIIRRERDRHPPEEWEQWLERGASVVYHIPADSLREYAHLRVQAMLLRDEKGEAITEQDWATINGMLQKSWTSFARALGNQQ